MRNTVIFVILLCLEHFTASQAPRRPVWYLTINVRYCATTPDSFPKTDIEEAFNSSECLDYYLDSAIKRIKSDVTGTGIIRRTCDSATTKFQDIRTISAVPCKMERQVIDFSTCPVVQKAIQIKYVIQQSYPLDYEHANIDYHIDAECGPFMKQYLRTPQNPQMLVKDIPKNGNCLAISTVLDDDVIPSEINSAETGFLCENQYMKIIKNPWVNHNGRIFVQPGSTVHCYPEFTDTNTSNITVSPCPPCSSPQSPGGHSWVIPGVIIAILALSNIILVLILIKYPDCRARVTSRHQPAIICDVLMETVRQENGLDQRPDDASISSTEVHDVRPSTYIEITDASTNLYTEVDDVLPSTVRPIDPALDGSDPGYMYASTNDAEPGYMEPIVTRK